MTERAIMAVKAVDPERAAARADELLKILRLPEVIAITEVRVLRDRAASALKSGEARAIAEALTIEPSKKDLGMMVGELIASFPPRPGQDLQIFSRVMAQDVLDAAPSRAALAGAARKLRACCTFLPSISEVLEAITEQKAACASRASLLESMPRKIAEIDRENNFAADGK